jgi:hypothetical protein
VREVDLRTGTQDFGLFPGGPTFQLTFNTGIQDPNATLVADCLELPNGGPGIVIAQYTTNTVSLNP